MQQIIGDNHVDDPPEHANRVLTINNDVIVGRETIGRSTRSTKPSYDPFFWKAASGRLPSTYTKGL